MAKKEVAWEHRIQRKKNGEAYGSLHNVQLVLAYDKRWRGVLAFDEFIGDIVTLKLPPWDKDARPTHFKEGNWSDKDTSRLSVWLSRHHEINAANGIIEHALYVVAEANSRHPIRTWLQGLKWDRVKRLDEMFIRICGARDEEYSREISKNFLIGAIARIMEPGCQLDSMPILEGRQGVGKTTFFKTLFTVDWFLSSNIDITNKDGYQVLFRKWCAELGELDSLSKRQVSAVKQFVSQPVDTFRPSYGRRAQDFRRQCVFAGTTNDFAYLKDGTGARRFWPLVVSGIRLPDGRHGVDLELLRSWREQLFAEAYVRYKKGEAWHITDPEILQQHEDIAEEKREVDPWETIGAKWIAKRLKTRLGRVRVEKGVSTHDLLTRALHLEPGKLTKHDEMRAAETLKLLGFTERVRISAGHSREWLFRKKGALSIADQFEPEEVSRIRRKKQGVVRPVRPKDKDFSR